MLSYLRLLSVFAVLLLGLTGVTACNTIEGAGEDVTAAGKAVDEAAEDSKDY